MADERDLNTINQVMSKLPGEDRLELALCILNSLLPGQMLLDVIACRIQDEELNGLSQDVTHNLRQLRDALLGS